MTDSKRRIILAGRCSLEIALNAQNNLTPSKAAGSPPCNYRLPCLRNDFRNGEAVHSSPLQEVDLLLNDGGKQFTAQLWREDPSRMARVARGRTACRQASLRALALAPTEEKKVSTFVSFMSVCPYVWYVRLYVRTHLWRVEFGGAFNEELRPEEDSSNVAAFLCQKEHFSDSYGAFCHVGHIAPSKDPHPTVIRPSFRSLINDGSSKGNVM
jgi:hypothetical protein